MMSISPSPGFQFCSLDSMNRVAVSTVGLGRMMLAAWN
jgi:hypothetical protein